MAMQIQPYVRNEVNFDPRVLETIILQLGDAFEIRLRWNRETAVVTGVFALVGGLVGGYAGGKYGAAVGAGVAGATGLGVASMVSLRQVWQIIKPQVEELMYVVFNFLRRLDITDYYLAYETIMACSRSRRELVLTIVDFIASKLAREVLCSITAA